MLKHEIIILNQGSQTRLPCINCSGMTPAVLNLFLHLLSLNPTCSTNIGEEQLPKYIVLANIVVLVLPTLTQGKQLICIERSFLILNTSSFLGLRKLSMLLLTKDKHYRDTCIHITHAPSRTRRAQHL